MSLPLNPPLAPQLARSRASLPEGDGWAYEPKYDGFRAVAFVDGDETYLQSRMEAAEPLLPRVGLPAGRYVLDGEIVAASFDTLGQRIHPAASRIARLAEETPATYYAFDSWRSTTRSCSSAPTTSAAPRSRPTSRLPVALTDVVRTAADAEHWLHEAEGVIAKEARPPYLPASARA